MVIADLLLKDNRLFENLLGVQYDYLAPFFWIHGESEELLVKELDALYDSNIRSVCFESRVHPDFCGDKYWRDMRFLLDECRKRNLRAWILDDVLCPSGTCNNLLKKSEYSDYMPWEIRECHVDIPGPVREGAISLEGHFSAETESIIAIVACRRVPDSNILTGDAVELTDCVADGMVYFTLGEGVWRIFMFVKTRQNVLPICDKLRPEATDFYISMVHQPHYDNLSEYFGNTLMGFFNDEPGFHNNHNRMYSTPSGCENAQYPWGECVSEGLAGIYGTDYCKKLCGLWYPFDDKSEEKLRCEYMNLISDAFGKNYTSKISSWCKIHGVELIGHILEDGNAHAKTGYGCGHFFKAMGDMDMSGIDVVLHQIVPGMTRYSNSADSSGTFEHYISTDKLFNVTGPAHKPRFSGKMLYKGKINLKKADSIVLDLGEVGEAVRVNINGNYVGSKPAPPYRFEISQYTSEGENEIEIEVSNHLSYSLRDGLSRFLLYEPSGLLGPINAEYYRVNRS